MRKIENIMSIGAKRETYTLREILGNVAEELGRNRYHYVPVIIFYVDDGRTLEMKDLAELANVYNNCDEGGCRYDIIRAKEGYRTVFSNVYDEETGEGSYNEIVYTVVLEEAIEW